MIRTHPQPMVWSVPGSVAISNKSISPHLTRLFFFLFVLFLFFVTYLTHVDFYNEGPMMLYLVSMYRSWFPLSIYRPKSAPSISVWRHYDVIYGKTVKTVENYKICFWPLKILGTSNFHGVFIFYLYYSVGCINPLVNTNSLWTFLSSSVFWPVPCA